jgi:hypothetical protein
MPAGTLEEVAQRIDFFQAQNTSLYASTIDHSSNSSWGIHNSHIYCFFYIYHLVMLIHYRF